MFISKSHQAATINPPRAGLQEEDDRVQASYLVPSDEQWHCHSLATHPWRLRMSLSLAMN